MSEYTIIQLNKGETLKEAIREFHPILEPTFRYASPGTDEIVMGFLTKGNTLEVHPDQPQETTYPPLTFHCKNGVIAHHQLEKAQRELNKGFKVVFTLETKGVSRTKAAPYETPSELSENPTLSLIDKPDFERLYYQLRTAIRTATLRHTGYKLPDTAIIAEDLKASNNLSNATDSFERLIQEVIDQTRDEAYRKGCDDTTNQYDPMLERAQQTEKRLRETIRRAVEALEGSDYHRGGVVGGESIRKPIIFRNESVIPHGVSQTMGHEGITSRSD